MVSNGCLLNIIYLVMTVCFPAYQMCMMIPVVQIQIILAMYTFVNDQVKGQSAAFYRVRL